MTSPDQVNVLEFRKAMGRFMTGVTIVSTVAPDGTLRGFTANSFTSVSLDPPLVLVCVANASSSTADFVAAPSFGVSILSQHQVDISARFARPGDIKFEGVACKLSDRGSPIIHGAIAWLDCARHEAISAGDHTILIGRVAEFGHENGMPLGYFGGRYVGLGRDIAPKVSRSH